MKKKVFQIKIIGEILFLMFSFPLFRFTNEHFDEYSLYIHNLEFMYNLSVNSFYRLFYRNFSSKSLQDDES